MFLANLSLLEFFVLFGGTALFVTFLYLLDRSRRRMVVSTLRFWSQAVAPTEARRRRIHQPWSLLLQLLSIALILLAVAQLRFGDSEDRSRNHILIVDASAWTAARSGAGSLMDEVRASALAYVEALPGGDRVMVIRADGLATPLTSFESDRAKVREAIESVEAGSAALDLDQAMALARRIRSRHVSRPGEIVFAGAGRLTTSDPLAADLEADLRYLPVQDSPPNVGLRRIGLRHSEAEASLWEVLIAVRNYGPEPATVDLALEYSGSPAGFRKLQLAPDKDQETTFPLRTQAGGTLEARVFPGDAFPDDDRATLTIPARPRVPVTVYSERPDQIRPLLEANPLVSAEFRRPGEYRSGGEGIVILDGFAPPVPPSSDAIWIAPPPAASPVPVDGEARNAEIQRWETGHILGTGLRTQDLEIGRSLLFRPSPDDLVVAATAQGPVIVARAGGGDEPAKTVVFGFHPYTSGIRYKLAAPLLFANIIRWMRPELFRHWELTAGSVGSVALPLQHGVSREDVQVIADDGEPIPFTLDGETVRFYAGNPGEIRILSDDREMVYSLTLPAVPTQEWEPPENVKRGVPPAVAGRPAASDIWYWLALLGGIGLIGEWMRYGRYRKAAGARTPSPSIFAPAAPGSDPDSPHTDDLRRAS